jgi:hypothetical protein
VVTGVIIRRSTQVLILNDLALGAKRIAVAIEGGDRMQRSAPVAALWQLGKGAREGQEAGDRRPPARDGHFRQEHWRIRLGRSWWIGSRCDREGPGRLRFSV